MFLPICGIDLPADPLAIYKAEFDTERAWNRELCLRMLKLNDSRRAGIYLSFFEQNLAEWLWWFALRQSIDDNKLPLAKHCDINKFTFNGFEQHSSISENNTLTIDVADYLQKVFNSEKFPDVPIESKVQANKLIASQQYCQLEQIYVPEKKCHRHVLIASAGFLS